MNEVERLREKETFFKGILVERSCKNCARLILKLTVNSLSPNSLRIDSSTLGAKIYRVINRAHSPLTIFHSSRSLKSSVTALGNTFIYIVALCAVDLLVTVSIPFSLSNSILNNWVFGELACKIHWMLELSNKVCVCEVWFLKDLWGGPPTPNCYPS